MLPKHELITKIIDSGIVAIARTANAEQARQVVQACIQGGLESVEITFTVDKAYKIIEELTISSTADCILGAGTILDSESARVAILSGASYIVSPSFDKSVAKLCNRYAVPYMAGCYTPTEIVTAMEYGVEIIKLFPGSLLSPSAIKALKAPLPQANIMPTGGVALNNISEWINAGAVALGVGGDLTAGVKSGNFASVTEKAKQYRLAVSEARALLKNN